MRIIDLTLPLVNGMRGVDIATAKRLDEDGWNATTLDALFALRHAHGRARPFPAGRRNDRPTGSERGDRAGACREPRSGGAASTDHGGRSGAAYANDSARDAIVAANRLAQTTWDARISRRVAADFVGSGRVDGGPASGTGGRRAALGGGRKQHGGIDGGSPDALSGRRRGGGRAGASGPDHVATVQFIALPLKVTGGDGTPVRAIAVEN